MVKVIEQSAFNDLECIICSKDLIFFSEATPFKYIQIYMYIKSALHK